MRQRELALVHAWQMESVIFPCMVGFHPLNSAALARTQPAMLTFMASEWGVVQADGHSKASTFLSSSNSPAMTGSTVNLVIASARLFRG